MKKFSIFQIPVQQEKDDFFQRVVNVLKDHGYQCSIDKIDCPHCPGTMYQMGHLFRCCQCGREEVMN